MAVSKAACNRDGMKMVEGKASSIKKELEAVKLEKDRLDMVHQEDNRILEESLNCQDSLRGERDQAVVDRDSIWEEMSRQRLEHVRAMSDMMARINERPLYLPGSSVHQNLTRPGVN